MKLNKSERKTIESKNKISAKRFYHALDVSKSNRRAVSEIIATLLMMSITIIGGVVVWSVVTGSTLNDIPSSFQVPTIGTVEIIGYDTRDGDELFGITGIDNESDEALKAGEFIIIEVRNESPDSAYLIETIMINDERHSWDGDTSQSSVTVSPPAAGEFGITSLSSTTRNPSNQLSSEREARLIISLSSSLTDIALTDSIRVGIVSPSFEFKSFLVPAGWTK